MPGSRSNCLRRSLPTSLGFVDVCLRARVFSGRRTHQCVCLGLGSGVAVIASRMAEPTTRFAHLLQPIRDLSKVWNIEIADELEKYAEEVTQLMVTNPEDGASQLNFAEAALLIQGSTAIYSRKVELLYQLVYQALELLAVDKGKDASQGKRAKASQNGLWAPIPETEELLTIDHLIKEGRNITLDRTAPEQRQALQRRVPLFLMPRDQSDRRKKDFRISTCAVHHTGAYLLQESDAKLLDDILMDDSSVEENPDAPLVPAPPREVQDLDVRLQELLKDMPSDNTKSVELPETPLFENHPDNQVVSAEVPEQAEQPAAAPFTGTAGQLGSKQVVPAAPVADHWALLDEHQVIGGEVPLEVGKSSRRVNAKKLLMNSEGLPSVSDLAVAEDAGNAPNISALAPLLAAGNPVESLFLAVAGHLKSGGRYETQRAAFSPAWLEFEDLFSSSASKRRHTKTAWKKNRAGEQDGVQGSDGEASGDEGGAQPATPSRPLVVQEAEPMTPGTGCTKIVPEMSEEKQRHEDQRREVALLEGMIQDAQQKYESTIRDHLQALQKDWVDVDNHKFPQLYANVRRWQDEIEPVLKDFESRPAFDIHTYSSKFLKKMTAMDKSREEESAQAIPFSRLVYGQPRWEVCRRFLTCLLLTNQGNTDIEFEGEGDRLNNFGVKLLEAEQKPISLDSEEAAPLPAPNERSRMKAASQPDLLAGPSKKRRRIVRAVASPMRSVSCEQF
eukprot:TRINITY_DN78262_c0_g1_i1.p1 TRINITY_DN78262_c0_g1~~TRINITY_DN78262_c0_g1_i1.p1  ORF type:complete len:730 (+),score=166.10 TRINITY_DN78262_c0_g1_i1:8-2197(+)